MHQAGHQLKPIPLEASFSPRDVLGSITSPRLPARGVAANAAHVFGRKKTHHTSRMTTSETHVVQNFQKPMFAFELELRRLLRPDRQESLCFAGFGPPTICYHNVGVFPDLPGCPQAGLKQVAIVIKSTAGKLECGNFVHLGSIHIRGNQLPNFTSLGYRQSYSPLFAPRGY